MTETLQDVEREALLKLLRIAREERDHWQGRAVRAEAKIDEMHKAERERSK